MCLRWRECFTRRVWRRARRPVAIVRARRKVNDKMRSFSWAERVGRNCTRHENMQMKWFFGRTEWTGPR